MKPSTASDLNVPSIEAALAGRLIGRILYHQALDSTMDEVRRLAEDGHPEGTVVLAEEQAAGRGRFERPWHSAAGESLLFTVLLRPGAAHLPQLNMAASLAVAGAADEFTGGRATVKWPNDVRVKGRKIAGILVETAVEKGGPRYAAVGFGVNVNLETAGHPEIDRLATSLHSHAGHRLDRTAVLTSLLRRFDRLYGEVRDGASLTQRWSDRLETLGRNVRVSWQDRASEGYARAVDEMGRLIIDRPDGTTVTVSAGEVTLQE